MNKLKPGYYFFTDNFWSYKDDLRIVYPNGTYESYGTWELFGPRVWATCFVENNMEWKNYTYLGAL